MTKLRVVVAEDDPAMRLLISTILSSAGHEVIQASTGREALKLILANCPDALVTDWAMPDMDGIELCRRVRETNLPHYLYVIFATAKARADEMVEGLEAGADDFISKPIKAPVLLARLKAGTRVIALERKLRRASAVDPLTGVLNRRSFHRQLKREWKRASRYRRPLSCVMLDLDFFKKINDTHGHATGDATLKAIAKLLKQQRRASDVVCRYGGEEFCILLPETDEDGAASWAEHARKTLAETPIRAGEQSLQVTASFGVAEGPGDLKAPESLVELADQALTVAKQSGRNRLVRFSAVNNPLVDLSGNSLRHAPLEGVVAQDVMAAAVFCPHEHDTIEAVADTFLKMRISSAPIVDDDGSLLGIVSETDLMTRTASGEGWSDPVRSIMKTNVVCYDENTPVRDVFQFLSRVSLRLVVVVRQGKPIGAISRGTLLRWFRNWIEVHKPDSAVEFAPSDGEDQAPAAVIKTAEATARRAAELPKRLAENPDDLVPCVVGEATRLQELVNDLLGQCKSQVCR